MNIGESHTTTLATEQVVKIIDSKYYRTNYRRLPIMIYRGILNSEKSY